MRGNRCGAAGASAACRSIPACAGEPNSPAFWPTRGKVYPRVCGGTRRVVSPGTNAPGLSPRVRGNHTNADQQQRSKRSIPACAGEPAGRPRRAAAGKVYPRVCGGTWTEHPARMTPRGLSPRVRGNQRPPDRPAVHRRSIPACAGEPRKTAALPCGCEVYPRVCGGTPTPVPSVFCRSGLSPRVRGNQAAVVPQPQPDRSIPACAGEPAEHSGLGGVQ